MYRGHHQKRFPNLLQCFRQVLVESLDHRYLAAVVLVGFAVVGGIAIAFVVVVAVAVVVVAVIVETAGPLVAEVTLLVAVLVAVAFVVRMVP